MGSAGVIIYPKSNMSATLENDFAEGASRKLSEEDARKRKMQGPLSNQCCLVITDAHEMLLPVGPSRGFTSEHYSHSSPCRFESRVLSSLHINPKL